MPRVRFSQRLLRKLLAPLARFYYRFGFAQGAAWWRLLGRWVERWEELSGRGDIPLSAARWDEQYAAGRWDFLADVEEIARLGATAAFVERAGARGLVLDLGCGEGLLADLLHPSAERPYLGVDLSAVALERAQGRAGPNTTYTCADAETYSPPSAPAAVVMNESLYYFREPIAGAARYASLLAPDGLLVVSMFSSPRTEAILRALSERLPLADRVAVEGRRGRWNVAVFRALTAGWPTAPKRG